MAELLEQAHGYGDTAEIGMDHRDGRGYHWDIVRALISVLAGVGLFLVVVAGRADGHQDPVGDIHPQVLVKDGHFAIVFQSPRQDQSEGLSGRYNVVRTIYSPEGKLIVPRHPLAKRRSWDETGPVWRTGGQMRLGDEIVTLSGVQSGKPGYVLQGVDGTVTRVTLTWAADFSMGLLEDVVLIDEGIGFMGKEGGIDDDGMMDNMLRFYWFKHESIKPPLRLEVGRTVCIYDFPVASNLAYAGGRFWVAYMGIPAEEKEDAGLQLMLWSWAPGEKTGRLEALDSPAFGNSHLSLAAIGDRLCLAYHCALDGYPGTDARIVTVFRKAE